MTLIKGKNKKQNKTKQNNGTTWFRTIQRWDTTLCVLCNDLAAIDREAKLIEVLDETSCWYGREDTLKVRIEEEEPSWILLGPIEICSRSSSVLYRVEA